MKRIVRSIIFLFLISNKFIFGQVVYGIYEFTGTSTADNQLNSVTSQPSFGNFSTITRTNVTWVSGANLFVSSAWNQTATRDDNEYVSFSLTLTNPYTFKDISLSLSLDSYRTATGPLSGEVMYR